MNESHFLDEQNAIHVFKINGTTVSQQLDIYLNKINNFQFKIIIQNEVETKRVKI